MPHPKIDPFGSPIPDENGKMEWEEYTKLCDCKSGGRFTLQANMKSEDEFLAYLNKRELKLGLTLKVLSVEPFDGSMSVS